MRRPQCDTVVGSSSNRAQTATPLSKIADSMLGEDDVMPEGYLPLFYRRGRPAVSAGAMQDGERRHDGRTPGLEPIPEVLREDLDEDDAWDFLSDTMRKYDRQLLDAWRAEMTTLLTFSGLLAITISIFTVQAQTYLSDDPESRSQLVLSQISSQLSALDADQSLLPNTSFAPTSAFSPTTTAVKLNTIWILALALSLIAAFGAMTVHQWLRRIPIPLHMSTRRTIRLRQFRHIGLQVWHVDTIVSLLPVILQVSLVLFLVGFLYLLSALNHAVLLAFAILVGVALLVYLVSAVAPVFWAASPYKSPLVPILLIIVRAVTVPLVILALAFAIGCTYVLALVLSCIRFIAAHTCGGSLASYRSIGIILSFRSTLQGWLRRWTSFRRADFTDLEQLWSTREHSTVSGHERELEGAAVAWAPHIASPSALRHVEPCFATLAQEHKTRSALEWAGLRLGNFGWHDLHEYSRYSLLNPLVVQRVGEDGGEFAKRYRDLLLGALPKDWAGHNYVKRDPAIPGILILLLETMKIPGEARLDPEQNGMVVSFARLLMAICASQVEDPDAEMSASHYATNAARVPTALLFSCCKGGDYAFDRQEAIDVVNWALRQLTGVAALGAATASRHILNVVELVLASSAIAMRAVDQHPNLLSDEETKPLCRSFFASLGRFLDRYRSEIKLTASVCAARPAGTVTVVFIDALVSVAEVMVSLLEDNHIPTEDNCPSGPLYGRILEVCRNETTFENAMPHLQRFYDLLMSRRVVSMPVMSVPPTPPPRDVPRNGVQDVEEQDEALEKMAPIIRTIEP